MENILINILFEKNIDIIIIDNIKTNKYKDDVIEYKTNYGFNVYIINNICKEKRQNIILIDKSMLVNDKYIHLMKQGTVYAIKKYIKFIDINNNYYIKNINDFYQKRIYKNNKIYREIVFYKKLRQIKSCSYKQYRSGCEYKNNLLYVKQIRHIYDLYLFQDNLEYYKNFKLIL